MIKKTYQIDDEYLEGIRVDKYLADYAKLFSRSQIKYFNLNIKINDSKAKVSRKIHFGDTVEVEYDEPVFSDIKAEEMDLDIIFEDENVIVINKAQGIVVHPGAGNYTGTLVQGLMFHCKELNEKFDDKIRPGIVHRLDKETSGVIIAAKNPEAYEFLAKQFRERETKKSYLAIVRNHPRSETGFITYNLMRDKSNRKRFTYGESGGKQAKTFFRVLEYFSSHSFMLLKPKTGRTHQLRVHMLSISCPIVGDPVYSKKDSKFPKATMMLHAYKLKIILPGEINPRVFTAEKPERFDKILETLTANREV